MSTDRDCRFQRLPRLVTIDWIEQSWQEKTLLHEERKFTIGHLISDL